MKYLFLIFINILVYAQTPKDYAKIIINKLCSDDFSGRGYVNNGLDKSADFIANEFKKIGLNTFQGSYFQEFTYPVNYIENSFVSINAKELDFGIDYLITPNSPSVKASFKPFNFNPNIIDSSFINNDNNVIFSELEKAEKNSKAIFFPHKIFPENYIDQGVSANDFYNKLSNGIPEGTFDYNFDVSVYNSDNKLVHSLASNQSKTLGIQLLNNRDYSKINDLEIDVKTNFNPNFKAKNILGIIEGKLKKDSIIFIAAHYDHLGKINDKIFKGANDNASGVAFILSLAKYFSKNPPKYSLVFCAFSGEEIGLKGSDFFIKNPLINLKSIKMMLNFDMLGTGQEGIQIVNAKKYPNDFNAILDINEKYRLLKQIKYRGESCNSDHCPFDYKKIPAIFTYTLGGNTFYHDIYDTAENLELTKFNEVLNLFIKYIEQK